MRIVLKQPPPSFLAPYPATSPRSSLLIRRTLRGEGLSECTRRTRTGPAGLADPGHWPAYCGAAIGTDVCAAAGAVLDGGTAAAAPATVGAAGAVSALG